MFLLNNYCRNTSNLDNFRLGCEHNQLCHNNWSRRWRFSRWTTYSRTGAQYGRK